MLNFLFQKKRLGLALSGGTIRGLAHVGVLKVLEKNNIQVNYIAGTSAGSIFAAFYAAGLPIEKIENIAMEFDWKKVISPQFNFKSLISNKGLEKMLQKTMPISTFQETKIPLRIVATDFNSGKQYVFGKAHESIITAILASTAIPGLFNPIEYQNKLLVDGYLTNNMPVSVVKHMGADNVIGVNVIPSSFHQQPKNLIETLMMADDIRETANLDRYKSWSDLILNPVTKYIPPFASSKFIYKNLIKLGEEEARKHLFKILQLSKRKK